MPRIAPSRDSRQIGTRAVGTCRPSPGRSRAPSPTPSGVILMFAGFRSRWTMPFSCAASSASAICRAIASASVDRQAGCVGAGGARGGCDSLGERLAFDQLQHETAHAVRLFEAVDRADVRMIQRREHPRLALEARAPFRVGRERRRQDLDRDLAPELVVVRAVHLAHAAGAEQERIV